MDSPECPVCLQSYDGESTIPRVLGCGHSACEACLINLPQRHPNTIRCPACNVLVKYPSQGPSALPKNIELLRLCDPKSSEPSKPRNHSSVCRHDFVPRLWSEEFYKSWNRWVLPYEAVSIEQGDDYDGEMVLEGRIVCVSDSDSSLPVWVRKSQSAGLMRIGRLHNAHSSSAFEFGYVANVLTCLSEMKEHERNELFRILEACIKSSGRVSKACGLWGNSADGILYLVCERQNGTSMKKISDSGLLSSDRDEAGSSKEMLIGFAMVASEICEAVMDLHSQGLCAGALGLFCFSAAKLGPICVDIGEVLVMGRKVRKSAIQVASESLTIDDNELDVLLWRFMKQEAFISPEILLQLLKREGIVAKSGNTEYSVGCSSDSWSLACVLLRLLIGKFFLEDIFGEVPINGSGSYTRHASLMERVNTLLEVKFDSECTSLRQTLSKCFNSDPASRPSVVEIWRSIRELLVVAEFDVVAGLRGAYDEVDTDRCLVLGELLQLPQELSRKLKHHESSGGEANDAVDEDNDGHKSAGKDVIEGLSRGMVKSKDLLAHQDCVTGLAVGGNFLFSSSFDKTVHVWSLQDFSHVHVFKGHEHKVMALVYVDEELPCCVSADSGGGIFTWGISDPLEETPLKKWYEEKDWRYSGIHALANSGNGNIYSGGGDRSIKAWSMKDCTLLCTMTGHKSVVSVLVASDGVLYSGSWDGTIRLWSLNDHSPLAVLGEDSSGSLSGILSLGIDSLMLVAAYENGSVKIWRNDVLSKSMLPHNGAVFAIGMQDNWLFSGGWDKTINVQELSGDELQLEARQIGSIPCESVITALLYWQGKLFVGFSNRVVKVYYYEK